MDASGLLALSAVLALVGGVLLVSRAQGLHQLMRQTFADRTADEVGPKRERPDRRRPDAGPPSGGAWADATGQDGEDRQADAALATLARERDDLAARVGRLLAAGRTAISQRDDALARAERAEADLAALRDRRASGGTGGDQFRAAKAAFARLNHPDQIRGSSFERAIRAEVFKEYWAELERIERGD